MKDLVKIGVKVNDSIQAVWEIGLTTKELRKLEDYLNRQKARPIGFAFFDQAKERIKLLKPIIELKQREEVR